MFADDMMIFLKPTEIEMQVCAAILRYYGEGSGLHVNLTKSNALPIRCNAETVARICTILGCPVGTFPCKYRGLPLTLRKQTTTQFDGLVG